MAEVINTAAGVAAVLYQRLLAIQIANGYETNMGLTVFQGKTRVADEQVEQSGACLSVIEGIDTIENQAARGRSPLVKIEQRYGLVGYAVCDPNAPNIAAHAMLRDMKKAVWSPPANWDDQVYSIVYKSRDIGPRADGVNIVMALLEIGVVYAEDLSNP